MLDTSNWQRVKDLFAEALERPVEEQSAFLDEACGNDAEVRAGVERLLAANRRADTPHPVRGRLFLESMDATQAEALMSEEATPVRREGERIGPWRIIRELGRGGMGVVYLAERADGQFDQTVALKLVKRGMDSDAILQRFRTERQVMATLQHPYIARFYDGGVTEEGIPWFAMEHVEGKPITDYCNEEGLPFHERLGLFVKVCRGVEHAHKKLVIHRDLKPSNILVTEKGDPRILDFGLAKVLQDASGDPATTRREQRWMTLEYASPEQVRGGAVGTPSDTYQLGLVLYEMLTGRLPYTVKGLSPTAAEQVICETAPTRPSSAVVDGNGIEAVPRPEGRDRKREPTLPPEKLRRRLKGDLDTIILKVLHKDPDRGYASAESLADDIERHLQGLPIHARLDTTGYLVMKFVKRHRWGVAAAAAILLSLLGGSGVAMWQARVAAVERDEAQLEREKAEEISSFLTNLFELSNPDVSRGDEVTARELLTEGAKRIESELRHQPDVQARMMVLLGDIHRKLAQYDTADSILTRALAIRRELHGSNHPDVADVIHHLGELRYGQGRYDDSEQLFREALSVRESSLGEDHPETARNLRELASLVRSRGDLDEAEALVRRAFAIDSVAFGPVHEAVASDLNVLGHVLYTMNDYPGAASSARRTLAIRREVLGEDHLSTATAKNNLAVYTSAVGELDEAEALYRDVLAFDIERLGEEDPRSASVMNNLARVLMKKGELAASRDMFQQALDLYVRHFGDTHPRISDVLSNLGQVEREAGRLDESEAYFRRNLALDRELYGSDHHLVGYALANLADVLSRKGNYDEADSLFRESIRRLRASFPEPHLYTAYALLGRGRLLVATGRSSDGEPLIREALAMREGLLGMEDARTAEAREALGDCLMIQNRLEEAESVLLQAWGALEGKSYVERYRRPIAESLVSLYGRLGKPEQAAAYRVRLESPGS